MVNLSRHNQANGTAMFEAGPGVNAFVQRWRGGQRDYAEERGERQSSNSA